MKTCKGSMKKEEHDLLKREIEGVWEQFPIDMKRFIMETKKQKLQALYMVQDWAKNNNHQIIMDLVSRRIACHEDRLAKMKSELGE